MLEATEAGVGLPELEEVVAMAERGDLPTQALIEALGEAHTLDARFARERVYEPVFARLKRATYGTEDVVPDVVNERLHHEKQTIPWYGLPVHVRALEIDATQNEGYEPASVMTIMLGKDYVWHVQPLEGDSLVLEPGEEEELGREDLGGNAEISNHHLTLRNASPLGIELKDSSTNGTFYRAMRYPDPEQFRQEHDLAEALEQIEEMQ